MGLAAERARDWLASEDKLLIYSRPLDDLVEVVPGDGVEFRELTAADAAVFARDIGTESPQTFRRRLARHSTCFGISWGAALVTTTWMTRRAAWTREVGRYFHPPDGDAYVYESFTRPEMRGRGLWPMALALIGNELATREVGNLWVATQASNPASMAAVAKAGFELAGDVSYRRRLGRLTVEGDMTYLDKRVRI